jgi:DNA-binding response OmpR family regulator
MKKDAYHILLIEDDPDMHHAIRAMLPVREFELTSCSTGPAGLEAMRRDPPDLVLLDIMLATPSEGFHLCYQIKASESLCHVPIVMISAIGKRIGMDYAAELGSEYVPADAFLEKPFDARALLGAIRKLLPLRTP